MPDKDQNSPDPSRIRTPPKPGDKYVIPPEGSLGLLAMGAVGVREWRYVRDAAKLQGEETSRSGDEEKSADE